MTSGKLDDRQIAKIVNINGKNYVASGDIVLKRKDGSIHFLEREDRSFTRFDGYKIHPSKIEDIIRKHPCISDCIIVNYYDEQFSGNMPIIHVVLEDENIDKMQLINEIVFETMGNNKELTTRDIPTKWKFRNSIPLNMMQKKDYKALIKEGLSDEEFDVNIVENNMRIDNIEIKEPNLKKKIK
jgi:acyl-coenzyme A synthetase/AMP-(fatty) acid ligase